MINNNIQKEKALVAVAHADDHVLWMGGMIIKLKNEWDFDFICFCTKRGNYESIISKSFKDSCIKLGVEEDKIKVFSFYNYSKCCIFCRNNKIEMQEALFNATKNKKYDFIFTHGNEYGYHANHLEVKNIIEECKDKILKEKGNIFYFAYEALYGSGTASVASKNADYYVQLNYKEMQQKLDLINCFNSWAKGDLKSLAWPCPNPEAFTAEDISAPVPHNIFIRKS